MMRSMGWRTLGGLLLPLAFCLALPGRAVGEAPQSIEGLWADVDPRAAPLETQVVRRWAIGDVVCEYVVFTVGAFKGEPSRIAGFFAYPKGRSNLPGLLHLHGGGQRAFQREVLYYAGRGYACLSINWGGRAMEGQQPGEPNTDWGAVDPTQKNVRGYFNLMPGPLYLDEAPSPRNNNWYLLTLAGRRGLTFLEQQPQVDAGRLGVYGHSMGGNLTVYVAGSDDRVKAAAPSVGGSGFRTYPWPLLPQQRKQTIQGDVELFRSTLSFQAYAKRIQAPLLWLGATNDFHGMMDDTYRTGELIPHQQVRYAFAPHFNHRFTPETAIARPLWIDQHLKGGVKLPAGPVAAVSLDQADRVPRLHVTADRALPMTSVEMYYSIDPDPQARFWRSVDGQEAAGVWSASLPVMSVDQPLFAFANVHYKLRRAQSPPHGQPVSEVVLSSNFVTVLPEQLQAAGITATDQRAKVIDDFQTGWRDWYRLNAENPHHWQFWTRKLSDPKWRGGDGDQLMFQLRCAESNTLVVVLTEHFFRNYRGPQRQYVAEVKLRGGDAAQTVGLVASDFRRVDDGSPLGAWTGVDELGLVARFSPSRGADGKRWGAARWRGAPPTFSRVAWRRVDAK